MVSNLDFLIWIVWDFWIARYVTRMNADELDGRGFLGRVGGEFFEKDF